MASNDVVTLQDATFDQEVLKSEIPVLVEVDEARRLAELPRRSGGRVRVRRQRFARATELGRW